MCCARAGQWHSTVYAIDISVDADAFQMTGFVSGLSGKPLLAVGPIAGALARRLYAYTDMICRSDLRRLKPEQIPIFPTRISGYPLREAAIMKRALENRIGKVEYLSEILKILDGALKANASMASNYAGLLADKLDSDGASRQARMIRERLARAPAALATAQDASRGVSLTQLPVDGESRLHTVDVSRPSASEFSLHLPSALHERIVEFLENVEHYDALAKVGAALPSRLLTYGPPGTGKTMLARHIASKLDLPLLTVRCDTLVSSLLGQTSRNLRRVFEYSQQMPCVLLLDEFDALAGARGNERDVGELQRVVIALLQNIDALPESTILIAATNHDQLLDPAIWRRFSFRIPMPVPDAVLREFLWHQFLGSYRPASLDIASLVQASEGLTGAMIEQVCIDTKRHAVILGAAEVDETQLFRKLGLLIALLDGIFLSTSEAEITWLRKWNPKQFSLRNLAKTYKVSTRYVSNLTKEKEFSGSEKGIGSTRNS